MTDKLNKSGELRIENDTSDNKALNLPKDWIKTTLGEVAKTNQNSVSKNYTYKNIFYLDTGSITKGKIETFQKFKLMDAPSRAKRLVKNNDIVYSTVRPNQEHYGFICNPLDNLVVSTGFTVISSISINPKFLYYYLTQSSVTNYLHILAEHSTSAYPSIKSIDIENLELYIPKNISEQKAIANILKSFDDKIELLQAQNKTLETTVQTIFKEWFGKYKIGDKLPDGWRIGKLKESTEICGGTTPSTKNPDYWNGNINWTSPKDLSNSKEMFLLTTEKKITEDGLKKISSGLLPTGTLLLSSRAPVGYLSLTTFQLAINQGYIAILPEQLFSNYYMYLWLNLNMRTIENAANGSTFLEISKSSFRNIDCIIPEASVLKEFDNVIIPFFDKTRLNLNQIQTLARTRNSLLPKLMSGEIRVDEYKENNV